MITTSGAAVGDQSAGVSRGFARGSVGKAQAPSPGQALLYFLLGLGMLGDAGQRVCMVQTIFGVAIQEFLREIRVVVISILIRGRW